MRVSLSLAILVFSIVNANLVINKIIRTVSLKHQYVYNHLKITVENTGKSAVNTFLYALPDIHKNKLISVHI